MQLAWPWRRRATRAPAARYDRETIGKVCVLGDARSGKSELLRRHMYSMFDQKYITTIGTKVSKKSIVYNRVHGGRSHSVRLTLLIWDILGQKQYSRLHPVYYQGADGAVVVCDASAADAAQSLRGWAQDFVAVVGPRPLVLVLNRAQPAATRGVLDAAVAALSREFAAPVFEIEAGDDATIEQVLTKIGEAILDTRAVAAG